MQLAGARHDEETGAASRIMGRNRRLYNILSSKRKDNPFRVILKTDSSGEQ